MDWNGMFKKFNRSTSTDTTVVTQRGISAGGDVVGVREVDDGLVAEMVGHERFEELKAENERLTAQIRKDWQHEYDRGYSVALKKVLDHLDGVDGRTGKKQIRSAVEGLLTAHEEG